MMVIGLVCNMFDNFFKKTPFNLKNVFKKNRIFDKIYETF